MFCWYVWFNQFTESEGANMSEISILVAGDYSPKERFQKELDNNLFESLFPGVKEVISSCDYSVVNFESTIPTQDSRPIDKIGSHLSAKENAMIPLRWLGFNMLTMANNHVMDYGETAMEHCLNLAKRNGFDIVGVGRNLTEARCFKVIKIHENRIAFINACEHEFSIAGENRAGCNPLDIINLSYDIQQARQEADYVFVIIHGGNEHYKLPSPRMKKLYRFFIDQGADAVLNHHQHCYSGYEVYNNKPIFYGLGNFCFDSAGDIKYRHATYNYGYLVKLYLASTIKFELIPYEQCYEKPGVYMMTDQSKNLFNKDIAELNAIIADDKKLVEAFKQMAREKRKFVYGGFRPYTSRMANALYHRGLLPSFLNKKRFKIIAATLECESHNDILMTNLKLEK